MGLKPNHQKHLYDKHWRRMELAFGQQAYSQYFDGFIRHYLIAKTDVIPNLGDVYEDFKIYARPQMDAGSVDSLVADVHIFANYYCAMAFGKETDRKLSVAFADLRELKVDVAYPLLLTLYHDYVEGSLPKDDLEQAVRLVESYVFRRAVCAIPTNSMNKTFARFRKALNKERYLESVQAHFRSLQTYRRFPLNDEFRDEIKRRELYSFRNCSYLLRRLENYGRKESALMDDYTIEHIMPQDENLSEQWRKELGDNWQHIHQTLLHTLGNLTLTAYNSEYSNRPFAEKRDMKDGFNASPLYVNKGLGWWLPGMKRQSINAPIVWRTKQPRFGSLFHPFYPTKTR